MAKLCFRKIARTKFSSLSRDQDERSFRSTVSVMKKQLEQLTKRYSRVVPVVMDVMEDDARLSSMVKRHDLVIRSVLLVGRSHNRMPLQVDVRWKR